MPRRNRHDCFFKVWPPGLLLKLCTSDEALSRVPGTDYGNHKSRYGKLITLESSKLLTFTIVYCSHKFVSSKLQTFLKVFCGDKFYRFKQKPIRNVCYFELSVYWLKQQTFANVRDFELSTDQVVIGPKLHVKCKYFIIICIDELFLYVCQRYCLCGQLQLNDVVRYHDYVHNFFLYKGTLCYHVYLIRVRKKSKLFLICSIVCSNVNRW